MSGSIVKNQHYVPQRYLRKFGNVQRKQGKDIHRFNIFDKEKQQIRENQNIENYASERFFYDVDFEELLKEAEAEGITIDNEMQELTNVVDKQHLENVFATKVETTMYDPFENIVASHTMTPKDAYTKKLIIPEENKAKIAYYLSIQYLRTKEYREKMIQLYEKGAKLFLKKELADEVDPEFLNGVDIKLKKSRINLYHNQQLLNTEFLEELSKSLLSHIWFLAVNETDKLFYTSDNPIVLFGHDEHQGLKSRGIEIIFPITPRLALVMRELEYFKKDLVLYNKFVPISKDYVDFCNTLQVFQSYRNVFSKDNNFEMASNLLRGNPQLGNVNRDRFLMG